ncbi:hypothetical protein [Hugenholtzia roseola]|uniref:hypothetical protein n=1 Tax=Hugenholtzia roseola TaxID=1002 RepID=UPI0012B5EC20|nr:hypothetical protein [Hugenholtzia roseola]
MLKKLRSLDWAKLSHVYGSAADLPDLIEGLASNEEEMRQDALDALTAALIQKGLLFSASIAAIPFLLELLENEKTPDRWSIFWLLGMLYQGKMQAGLKGDPKAEVQKGKAILVKFLSKAAAKTKKMQLEYNDELAPDLLADLKTWGASL